MELVFRGTAEELQELFGDALPAIGQAAIKAMNEGNMSIEGANVLQTLYRFTKRELEVLKFVQEGYANQEIGERVGMSQDTVRSHVRSLMQKVGAKNRTHLAFLTQ